MLVHMVVPDTIGHRINLRYSFGINTVSTIRLRNILFFFMGDTVSARLSEGSTVRHTCDMSRTQRRYAYKRCTNQNSNLTDRKTCSLKTLTVEEKYNKQNDVVRNVFLGERGLGPRAVNLRDHIDVWYLADK